jgi:hypothetical protein
MQMNYPVLYDTQRIKFDKLRSNEDILYLFKQIFNRDFDDNLLNWLSSCPTGSNKWYAAFDIDIPIGIYGLLPINIRLGNNIYNAALCNNVGVVQNFQGKGLFQSLGEYALKDSNFPIVVGIPNSKAVKGHKRIGWKTYGNIELLQGVTSDISPEYITNSDFQYFPKEENKYFSVVKALDFIKWRYSRPYYSYFQSVFENQKYVIWKVYEGRKQILETNDFRLAIKLGGTVDIWQFNGSSESSYLKERGFVPLMSNEFILYTNLPISPNSPNQFCFELGDNDVF